MPLNTKTRNKLLVAARTAAKSAYAPYSRFRVGAAVWANGKIYTGCNVENASYGLTVCAERVAIFTAICAGAKRISALAVACPDASVRAPKGSRMPCGTCRQVMAEFAEDSFVAVVDQVGDFAMRDLLPDSFSLTRARS